MSLLRMVSGTLIGGTECLVFGNGTLIGGTEHLVFGNESGTPIICYFAYSNIVQVHNIKNDISCHSIQNISCIWLPDKFIISYSPIT